MNLHIQNYNKVKGYKFWNARFVCTDVVETETNYRFQFEDTDAASKRYIWVEINRIGVWDTANGGRWTYKLNYKKCPTHIVTATYLSEFENVISTMGTALKSSMSN
jgi:hypothetical protein